MPVVVAPVKGDAVDNSTCSVWMDILFSSSYRTETLLKSSKEVGTECLFMPCCQNVAEFRYLGMMMTNHSYILKEMKRRLIFGNAVQFRIFGLRGLSN
jgi:hypothetical protein